MHGAIRLLPQYGFMAWCLLKKTQGQLYIYLYTAQEICVICILAVQLVSLGYSDKGSRDGIGMRLRWGKRVRFVGGYLFGNWLL